MKSEKTKTRSSGWSVCGKECDCFRVYRKVVVVVGGEVGSHDGKMCVCFPFSFLRRDPQMGKRRI